MIQGLHSHHLQMDCLYQSQLWCCSYCFYLLSLCISCLVAFSECFLLGVLSMIMAKLAWNYFRIMDLYAFVLGSHSCSCLMIGSEHCGIDSTKSGKKYLVTQYFGCSWHWDAWSNQGVVEFCWNCSFLKEWHVYFCIFTHKQKIFFTSPVYWSTLIVYPKASNVILFWWQREGNSFDGEFSDWSYIFTGPWLAVNIF